MTVYRDQIVLNLPEMQVASDALAIARKNYETIASFGNTDYNDELNSIRTLEQRINNRITLSYDGITNA